MLGKRSKIEQSYRNITLPAAILNRSPLKASKISENSSIMGNSILSDRSNIADGPVCSNHPNKSGKYFIISDDDEESMDYCEKCAILLASQGFKVNRHQKMQVSSKVIQEPAKPTREQQLQQFVNKADEKFQKMKNIEKQTNSHLEKIPQKYQQNIKRINNFFTAMLNLIEKHRTRCLQLAKEQKQNSEVSSKLNVQFIQEKLDVIQSMKEDILASYDSIVKETPQKDYNLVMTHYKKTLEQIVVKEPCNDLREPFLPQVQVLQQVFSSTIGKDPKQTHFSFDTSRQTFD